MFSIILITTGLFIVTNSIENNPSQFSRNEDSLAQCIENHEIFKTSYYKNLNIVKTVTEHAVEKFSRPRKDEIDIEVKNMFAILVQEMPSSSKLQIPWNQLEKDTVRVIEDCFDKFKDDGNNNSESSTQANLTALPNFGNILQDIDDLLDFILVDWPLPLQNMINTREGQIIIKKFATDAIIALDRALNSVGNRHHFRVLLRTMWLLRARQYFDAGNEQYPYIRHRYTNNRKLMAEGDMNLFYNRSSQNFRDRNPPASQDALDRILNIHRITDCPGYGEYDIYSEYERNGMTEADNYLEIHIDQFYRILLYFAVSRATDTNNTHKNILKRNQAILYDDEVYAKSLSTARECVIKAMKKAQVEIELTFMSQRVIEEDLILALIFSIKNSPEVTTTTKISSSTQRYLESIMEDNESLYEDSSKYDMKKGPISITATKKISITTERYLQPIIEENESVYDDSLNYVNVDGPTNIKATTKIPKTTQKYLETIMEENELYEERIRYDSIINCFDNSEEISSYDSDEDITDHMNSDQLPDFDNEPAYMTDVLNYILVDFPKSLREMIENREDRAMLRSYAFEAIGLLNSALDHVTSNNYFRVQLRVLWMRRALLYFDGHSNETQRYIPHRYSVEEGLHTFSDLSMYYNRRFQNFSDRNPPVSQTSIQDLINGYVRQSASFNRGVMTSAQHHFESHLDQFFRILFFFTELEYIGIRTTETDTYEGRIPYKVMSESSQAIVYDNEVYMSAFFSEKSLIYEEDLIMAFGEWFQYSFSDTTVDTNCSSTDLSTISTTPKYRDSNFEKNDCKKKKGRRNFARQSETTSSKREKQKKKTNHKSHGYIIYNGDYNQILFTEIDSSMFLRGLHENMWGTF